MNNLTHTQNPSVVSSMTSREVADLTGKNHKDVMRDCRNLISEYEKLYENQPAQICALVKSGTYKDKNGTDQPCYELNKQASLDLVTGYSLPHRHAVNKRWMELEEAAARPALPDFTNPVEAARAWADAKEAELKAERERQAALAQIEADKPKVEFAMAVRNLDGSCLVREFAKVMGTGQNRMFKWLRDNGYLMANNQPYQDYIDRGWFVVVEGVPFTDSRGKSHPTFTTRITGKGQVALEKKIRPTRRNALVILPQAGGTH